MDKRYFIIIDETVESQAPFFAQNPIFQTWLRAYNNVPEALKFISQIKLPYSINVYLARDNIFDDGLPSNINGQIPTLIQTLNDLQTVHLVTIFTPNISTDTQPQIRAVTSYPRLIKDVISVVDLHGYMCLEGTSYFDQEISRCIVTKEAHLTQNLSQNREELMKYLERVHNDRQQILNVIVEEHFNKPSEESQ
ncbi:unnamed protein product [Rotaria sordida]|uniref:Uncharacterized protein n=1 Tax=Rotaria sordida TaxID=392033 RepID=A0A813UXD3_9BILA|nr:unnamed protein product [Rotaria sordida]CAF0856259.1 unnamed protein product [Rotaria sordida]